jgi:uncharacterized protein YegL
MSPDAYDDQLDDELEDELAFAENPAPRLAVCLCLDVSSSMEGEKIAELNRGVQIFLETARANPRSRETVEVAVVTFASTAELVTDYTPVDRVVVPELVAYGGTSMGAGVKLALDQLALRKDRYKTAGIEYYQPWLVLMTDGQPNDPDPRIISESARRAAQLVGERTLTVMPVGIGADANLEAMQAFSPKNPPLRLQGYAFDKFFTWFSKSAIKVVSDSNPGDDVDLDIEGIKSWASHRA